MPNAPNSRSLRSTINRLGKDSSELKLLFHYAG